MLSTMIFVNNKILLIVYTYFSATINPKLITHDTIQETLNQLYLKPLLIKTN